MLPSAGNVSLVDSGAALIPYEYYFDGNEMFNITAKGDYFKILSVKKNLIKMMYSSM